MTTAVSPAPAPVRLCDRSNDSVRTYYSETRWDFRLLWSATDLHFGLYDHPWTRHATALRNTNRLLADLAGIRAGSRLLDAGCGVGGCSLQMAAERGALCTGITLVEAQARVARGRAARLGLGGRTDFRVADYTRSGLPAASFDAVIATESLCHASDKSAFYVESARLLKPGGRLVVAEYMQTAGAAEGTAGDLLAEWLEGWALPGLHTAAEHRVHAVRAGFGDVRIDDRSADFRRSLRRLYGMSAAAYPLAAFARAVGLRSRVQHGNVLGSLRFWQAFVRGAWVYATLSATRRGAAPVCGADAEEPGV